MKDGEWEKETEKESEEEPGGTGVEGLCAEATPLLSHKKPVPSDSPPVPRRLTQGGRG